MRTGMYTLVKIVKNYIAREVRNEEMLGIQHHIQDLPQTDLRQILTLCFLGSTCLDILL